MKHFQSTKTLDPVPQMNLWSLCAKTAPGAYYAAGRGRYLPIVDSEMATFLRETQIDRYEWRKAVPGAIGRSGIEVVCCTFSALLLALVEQERLIQRVSYPLAFARVEVITDAGGHSLNGYFNESREWRFVEPQDDCVYTWEEAREAYPGIQVQNLMFV